VSHSVDLGIMTREELERLLVQQSKSGANSALDALNERELEVFSILGQGYSSRQIESEFGFNRVELAALKTAIQKKLNLKTEVQLLQFAVKHRGEQ
jgi:DNA-binding CsgD family transcriptional regulator